MTTYIITGLTNGTTYDVRVRASNAIGTGSYSTDRSVTPVSSATAPSKISSITVSRGNGNLTVSATAPDDGGADISSYQFQWKSGNQDYDSSRQKSSSSRSTSITGLTNGTQYTIRARAINSVGNGPWSNDFTGTPATTPGVPGFTLSAGDRRIVVRIVAPSTGGSSITGYRVQWKTSSSGSYSSSNQADTTLTTYIITGLTNGTTYDVRVRASNAIGTGSYSTDRSVTPVSSATAPSKISSITVSRGNGNLTVSATAPDDGGADISSYQFQWKSGNQDYDSSRQKSSSSRSTSITGLTNGTQYTIRARAINSVGNGPWSNDFTGTPATTPGVPGFTLSAGDRRIVVRIVAPSTGGSSITGYRVQWKTSSSGSYSSSNQADTTLTTYIIYRTDERDYL